MLSFFGGGFDFFLKGHKPPCTGGDLKSHFFSGGDLKSQIFELKKLT